MDLREKIVALHQGMDERGLLGLALPLNALLLWPVLTFVAGLVCGLWVFQGEKSGGAFRFLGDQRLPTARLWAIKTLCWGGLAVAVALWSNVPGPLTVAVTVIVVFAFAASDPIVHGSAEQPLPLTFVMVMFVGVSVTLIDVAVDGPAFATVNV